MAIEGKHEPVKGVKKSRKKAASFGVSNIQLIGMFLDTGWRVAAPILLFTLFGHWLDIKLKTSPLLIIIGLLISLLTASLLVYKQLKVAFPDMFGGAKK